MPKPDHPPIPDAARERSKMIVFYVNGAEHDGVVHSTPWLTLLLAREAANLHHAAMIASGDAWAINQNSPPVFPDAGPYNQYQSLAAVIYIALKAPTLGDPPGAVRENYSGTWVFGGP